MTTNTAAITRYDSFKNSVIGQRLEYLAEAWKRAWESLPDGESLSPGLITSLVQTTLRGLDIDDVLEHVSRRTLAPGIVENNGVRHAYGRGVVLEVRDALGRVIGKAVIAFWPNGEEPKYDHSGYTGPRPLSGIHDHGPDILAVYLGFENSLPIQEEKWHALIVPEVFDEEGDPQLGVLLGNRTDAVKAGKTITLPPNQTHRLQGALSKNVPAELLEPLRVREESIEGYGLDQVAFTINVYARLTKSPAEEVTNDDLPLPMQMNGYVPTDRDFDIRQGEITACNVCAYTHQAEVGETPDPVVEAKYYNSIDEGKVIPVVTYNKACAVATGTPGHWLLSANGGQKSREAALVIGP